MPGLLSDDLHSNSISGDLCTSVWELLVCTRLEAACLCEPEPLFGQETAGHIVPEWSVVCVRRRYRKGDRHEGAGEAAGLPSY